MPYGCGCQPSAPCNDCRVSPPRVSHQQLRDSTPPPIYKRNVIRNSTPAPDVIERTHVRRQPRVIIDNITEQPTKPPPRIVDRVEIEPAEPPIVRNSCVNVPPRSRGCYVPRCSSYAPRYYTSSSCGSFYPSYRTSRRYYGGYYDDFNYSYGYY